MWGSLVALWQWFANHCWIHWLRRFASHCSTPRRFYIGGKKYDREYFIFVDTGHCLEVQQSSSGWKHKSTQMPARGKHPIYFISCHITARDLPTKKTKDFFFWVCGRLDFCPLIFFVSPRARNWGFKLGHCPRPHLSPGKIIFLLPFFCTGADALCFPLRVGSITSGAGGAQI